MSVRHEDEGRQIKEETRRKIYRVASSNPLR